MNDNASNFVRTLAFSIAYVAVSLVCMLALIACVCFVATVVR